MFGKKKMAPYDKDRQIPALRCSICTGEQVAGFKDRETGKFQDVMLIKNDRDLRKFQEAYGVEELVKLY